MSASHLLFDTHINDNSVTMQEPSAEVQAFSLDRRLGLTNIFCMRLARIGGQLTTVLKSKELNCNTIHCLIEELANLEASLPASFALRLDRLGAPLLQIQHFDLQGHIPQTVSYHIQGSIHRLGFFLR